MTNNKRLVRYTYIVTSLFIFLTILSSCGGGNSTDDRFHIVSIKPDEGSSTATIDSSINVTFNRPVNEELVSKSTFYLTDEHSHEKVKGEYTVSADKRTISFKPDALFFERHYETTVHHTITDVSGQHLSPGTKTWEFFTQEKPAIFSFEPAIGATEVNIKSKIRVEFDRNVNVSTVNSSNFVLTNIFGVPIPTQVDVNSKSATLSPQQPLALGTTYLVQVNTGILDINGFPLPNLPFSWSFTTSATASTTFHFGTAKNDAAHIIAVDNQNNIYIAGETEGILPNQTNAGSYDAFVAKLDPSGNILWVNEFGNEKFDTLTGLAVSPTGEIFISGHSDKQSFSLEDEQSDILFAKIDSLGSPPIIQTTGASDGHDFSRALLFDSLNNYYVIGSTMGTVPNSLNPNQGLHDIFIAKYDSVGNFLWIKQYGTTADEAVESAEIINDTIYIVASIQNTDQLPSDPLPTPGISPGPIPPPFFLGNSTVNIFAFNTEGNYQWEKELTNQPSFRISNITHDSANKLYVATFGFNEIPSVNFAESTTVHILDINGTEINSFTVVSETPFEIDTLELDTNGYIYLGGTTMDSFDPTPIGSGMGGPVQFTEPATILEIKKLDPAGTEQWSAKVKATRHASITDMTLNSSGDIYATGFTHGGVDGNSMIGTQDAFIFKVNANGQVQ